MRNITTNLIVLCTFGILGTPAFAGYVSVDLSSYVNNHVSTHPDTFPTGNGVTGNQGSGIPFDISTYQSVAGAWLAPSTGASVTVDLTGLSLTGQVSFYALLNNYDGTANVDEYDVTVATTNGDSVTYQSIGGKDTRDYNQYIYTNVISNTTFPWFDNGIGQRLDLREFTLPTSFSAETLKSLTITQNVANDWAIFSGLTFSTSATIANPTLAPEPSTWLLGASTLALAFVRLRSRSRA